MSSKPPRMRTACTECHSSKVRCSGEKTGCARCRQNNLNCVYKMSMVGRTTKKRSAAATASGTRNDHRHRTLSDAGSLMDKQQRQSQSRLCSSDESAVSGGMEALLHDMSDSGSVHFPSSATSLDLQEYTVTGNPQLDFPEGPLDWTWDLTECSSAGEPIFPNETSIQHVDPSHTRQTQRPRNTASELPRCDETTRSTTATAAMSSLATPRAVFAENEGNEEEAEHSCKRIERLMSLCRKTLTLEDHLRSQSGTLDEIMKLNKTCLAEVLELASTKEHGELCRCSFSIITTCLDTILVLMEKALQSSGLDSSRAGAGGTCGGALMPSLQFGVFKLDPQDQLVITRRILAMELQHYRDVVKKLAGIVDHPPSELFRKLMAQWLSALAVRVDKLPIT